METIITKKESSIGIIELNRPDSYNSINQSLALNLQNALDRFGADESVRCIIITGKGKAFCAGQDLVEIVTPETNPGITSILEKHYNPIIRKIRTIPKPIIAKVNGVAAGAGANIALSCDIVIAIETANFIQSFSNIGLVPDSAGSFFLPRLVGFQKASALAMLGDKINAEEADKMGMIYKYYPVAEFEEKTMEIARKLSNMPTKGLSLIKKALNASLGNSLSEQLDVENVLQLEASETLDFQEGIDAFLNKRKPNFKGK